MVIKSLQAMKIAQQFPYLNLTHLSQAMLTDPKQNNFKEILFKATNRKGKIDFGDRIERNIENKQIIPRIDQRYRATVLSEFLKLGKPECKPVCPKFRVAYYALLHRKVSTCHYN
ncbi:hypothetical protein J8M21_19500 [Pseudoalteromonas luteoviolacea]|uniref:hypothetical protein n=2 Tax=Pseudoalteromonas luteoviolacea TaxID=43657 RepID=UPI001B3A705D|nr:hypothetical protein [Pseudoalteromonas luteoviolacea]MBQ4879404.1 hypothetical protein [Pseudoalteromonas luteoviolacea]